MPQYSPARSIMMTTFTWGDMWVYSQVMAHALSARGIRVVLAAMGPAPFPSASALQKLENKNSCAVRWLSGTWESEAKSDSKSESQLELKWNQNLDEEAATPPSGEDDIEKSRTWLMSLAAEFQPDVIHCNTFAHGNLRYSCPAIVVGHECAHAQWGAVKGSTEAARERHRELIGRSLRGADLAVTPTRHMLNEW